MAILPLSRAEGLRNQRVQTDEKPTAKESQHMHKNASQTDRRDGRGAVGEPTDHHGVDDGHAHPAEFGEDERNRELQGGAEFGAKCLESDHELETGETSVSGAAKRSNGCRRNEIEGSDERRSPSDRSDCLNVLDTKFH